MNKKQILTLLLPLALASSSTFALELGVKEKVDNAFTKKEVKTQTIKKTQVLIESNTIQAIQDEHKENLIEEKEVNKKPELTLKEKFFIKIKEAKTEEERKEIFDEFKKELKEEKVKKSELMENKTEKIFNKFDLIIEKLDTVKNSVSESISVLRKKNIDLTLVNEKNTELEKHLELAKSEKAEAWIKMQEIDFSLEKEVVLSNLGEVKKHLVLSKEEIRETSLNLKELIFFIRGALTNLK